MTKKYLQILLCGIMLILLASCTTLGYEQMEAAKTALMEGENSRALYFASEALVQNPEYNEAKEFLKENFDSVNGKIQEYLKTTATSKDLNELDKRFDTYTDLVLFYANLKKVGMPLSVGDALFGLIKGWSWDTPLVDYDQDLEKARLAAKYAFKQAGIAAVNKADIDGSEELFDRVVGKYSNGDAAEKKVDIEDITKTYIGWAGKFNGNKNLDNLLKALDAYKLAVKYDPENVLAKDGVASMKLQVSDAYVVLAVQKEKQGTIDSVTEAVELFSKAISYNKENADAIEGRDRAKNTLAVLYTKQADQFLAKGDLESVEKAFKTYEIALKWNAEYEPAIAGREKAQNAAAELHYKNGIQLAKATEDDESLKAALQAFKDAQGWVKGYKDTDLQIGRVEVVRSVLAVANEIAVTAAEYGRIKERADYIGKITGAAHQGMEDLNYLADKVVQLDQQIAALKGTATALGAIPVVGTVMGLTKTALNKIHPKVTKVANKVKDFRRPFITPAREAIAKINDRVIRMLDLLGQVGDGITTTSDAIKKVNNAVARIDDLGKLSGLKNEIVALQKIINKLNKGLGKVNTTIDEVQSDLKVVSDSISVVSKVKKSVEKVMRPLDKIKGITSEINDVLQKRIKIPLVGSFTVEEALNSTTGLVTKAANALLNPILKKLKIDIPDIPGVEEYEAILDKVKSLAPGVSDASKLMAEAVGGIDGLPGQMIEKVQLIQSYTEPEVATQ